MLIAVATDDYVTITGHVGRCNGFLIYEVHNNEITSISERENRFTHHKLHGADDHSHGEGEHHGHSHIGLVEGLKDCKCLIANAAGRPLVMELERNGIEVVLTLQKDPQIAALAYEKGELKSDPNAVCKH